MVILFLHRDVHQGLSLRANQAIGFEPIIFLPFFDDRDSLGPELAVYLEAKIQDLIQEPLKFFHPLSRTAIFKGSSAEVK